MKKNNNNIINTDTDKIINNINSDNDMNKLEEEQGLNKEIFKIINNISYSNPDCTKKIQGISDITSLSIPVIKEKISEDICGLLDKVLKEILKLENKYNPSETFGRVPKKLQPRTFQKRVINNLQLSNKVQPGTFDGVSNKLQLGNFGGVSINFQFYSKLYQEALEAWDRNWVTTQRHNYEKFDVLNKTGAGKKSKKKKSKKKKSKKKKSKMKRKK